MIYLDDVTGLKLITGLTISHVVEVDVSVAQRAPGHRVSAHPDGRHRSDLYARTNRAESTQRRRRIPANGGVMIKPPKIRIDTPLNISLILIVDLMSPAEVIFFS